MPRHFWKRLAWMLVLSLCVAGLSRLGQTRLAGSCLRYTGTVDGVSVTVDLYGDPNTYEAALPRHVRVFRTQDTGRYGMIGWVQLAVPADFADEMTVTLTDSGGTQKQLLFLDQEAADAEGKMKAGAFVGSVQRENTPLLRVALYQNGMQIAAVPVAITP